jgi:ribA/ribD-fused uncharacterized protein
LNQIQTLPAKIFVISAIVTDDLCETPRCSMPAYPGSKYCSRNHRDTAIYGPENTTSLSAQKLRLPLVETGYHSESESKIVQKHRRRRTHSFSAPSAPYQRPYNPNEILFYDRAKKYYEFTNFSPHSIRYNMKDYPSAEHLFQSLKFTDPRDSEIIRRQPSPRDAFEESRRLSSRIRKDWIIGKINLKMMERTVLLKFTQHENLREMLLGTGKATLIEDSPLDSFWGIGSDGKGQNELGKALEKLRAILRERE